MKPQKSGGVEFFSVVMADIKNGFVVREIYYFLDIKKVSYGLISYTEFQHRTVQDTQVAPEVIGDKAGITINYRNITMPDFIASQILNRIRLKFQKPEVKQNADVDKEVEKIVAVTVKTYDFKDFSEAELNNLISNKRLILNRAAIWEKPIE
jgi:intein/homing endonuclease